MYSIDWPTLLKRYRDAVNRRATPVSQERKQTRVSPVVWALGYTSLLTDISSEMIGSILPVYLVLHLRMTPLAFGAVDGIYQGLAALLRLLSGFAGDYLRRHKAVATFGYALSAFCRMGLLIAGDAWMAIAAVVALDRTGKGIRTAPRDAMISLNSPPGELARAFGVHRSLDAAGAMLGPLIAFLFLAWMPTRFDIIFVSSFSVAIIGVAVIALFVPNTSAAENVAPLEKPSLKQALALSKGTSFRPLLVATSVLSLATISDAFIFLSLQEQVDFSAGLFPLLFVGVSLTNFAMAAPMGRLADGHGRLGTFIGGHVLLLMAYLVLLVPGAGIPRLVVCLVLLGAYYASTDGVLAAIATNSLPASLYGSGLALLATATNVGRLVSSLAFGVLWNSLGQMTATSVFTATLVVALVGTVMMLRTHPEHAAIPAR